MAHDHEHDADSPTPEDEVRLAREALADGDPAHAAHHVGGAIGERPEDPEVLALIDELANAAPGDPLDLVPLEPGVYFGAVAVRSYLLARSGNYDDAIALLCQVIAVVPERPFLAWVETWLGLPGVIERIDPEDLARSFDQCLSQLQRQGSATHHDALQERLLALARQVRETRGPSALLGYFEAVHTRRAGRLEEAEQLAVQLHAEVPGYLSAIALAGALRQRGKLEQAIEAFESALEHDPEDVAARLDIGDMLLEAGRFQESLDAYEAALEREPQQPWAAASACFVRYLLDGAPRWRDELESLTGDEPTNQRAFELLDALRPYVLHLEPPASSMVNGAAEAFQRGYALTSMAVSGLEPPSARLVVDWITHLLDPESGPLEVSVGEVPRPDPRQPTQPVRHLLWSYEGVHPRPGLEAPPQDLVALVQGLARDPYDLGDWSRRAGELAAQVTPARLPGLLAVMVHRPAGEVPDGLPPWVWLFRCQVAAALVAVHVDPQAAWPGSAREQALHSLLHGPLDWTTAAAILASSALLDEEPQLLPAILPAFLELFQVAPSPIWHSCVRAPLLHCLPRVQALDASLRERLEAQQLELLRSQFGE